MRQNTAFPKRAFKGTVAFMVMLFALWSIPAVASSVKVVCNDSAEQAEDLNVPVRDLAIKVVEHGAADSISAGEEQLTESIHRAAPLSPAEALAPHVEAILRDAFEGDVGASATVSSMRSFEAASSDAPLADAAVLPTTEESEAVKEAEDLQGNDELPATRTRLPGVSEEDLMRYKKRMYRNDI